MKTDRLTISDIEQWIDNDEGLYRWWRGERGSKREFIKRVLHGTKPAHYLAYGG